MKEKIFCLLGVLFIALTGLVGAQDQALQPAAKPKVIIMIAEQNINSDSRAWWLSEVDLSATEAAIASVLLEQGVGVIDPAIAQNVIASRKAFRVLDLDEKNSYSLGELSGADYIIIGKAVASAGGNVPESQMRSCFANISLKVLDVKKKTIISYLDASGSSAHLDIITGGKEALRNAANSIATKIMQVIVKQDAGAGAA